MGRARPSGMRLVLTLLIALLGASASAQSAYPRPNGWNWYGTSIPNGTTGIDYVSGGARLTGGPNGSGVFQGRNFGAPSSRGVPMGESVRLPVGGANILVNGARFITMAEAANAAGMLYGAWSAGQFIGSSLYEFMSPSVRLHPTGAGWEWDAGQNPTSGTVSCTLWDYEGQPAVCGDGADAAAALACAWGQVHGYDRRLCPTGPAYDRGGGRWSYPSEGGSADVYNRGPGSGPGTACPASTDPFDPRLSVPAGSSPGKDGKCPTGRYTGVPFDFARKRLEDYGNPDALPRMIPDLIEKGVPLAGEPIPDGQPMGPSALSGPRSSDGPSTVGNYTPPPTPSDPNPAPQTTTNNTTNNYTYIGGDTVNYNTTNNTTNPDGSKGSSTTKNPELKVCGVPGQPACKIDETGTPTAGVPSSTTADIQSKGDALKGAVTGVAAPTLGWTLGLTLPSGTCSALTFGAGGGRTWSVDLCTNPLVNALRAMLAWALGAITAVYSWRRVVEVMSS